MLFSRPSVLLFRPSSVAGWAPITYLNRHAINEIRQSLSPPKRAANPYNLFYVQKFPEIKRSSPAASIPDIAKRIGAEWQRLGVQAKQSFIDRAKQGLQQAQHAKEAYQKSLTPRQSLALRLTSIARRAMRGTLQHRYRLTPDEQALVAALPKKPYGTGRALFMASRMKGSGKQATAKLKEAAGEWTRLSEMQRSQYEQQAQQDQRRFREAIDKLFHG